MIILRLKGNGYLFLNQTLAAVICEVIIIILMVRENSWHQVPQIEGLIHNY